VSDDFLKGKIDKHPTPREMEEGRTEIPQRLNVEETQVDVVNETSPKMRRPIKSSANKTKGTGVGKVGGISTPRELEEGRTHVPQKTGSENVSVEIVNEIPQSTRKLKRF
jgi:hypothetical protein